MEGKLFDSELRILNVIWKKGSVTAKEIAQEMKNQVGWSKATTYTLIRRCIDKGAIERTDPKFVCRALVSREEIRHSQVLNLIDKLYDGIPDQLVASLLTRDKYLSQEKIAELTKMVLESEEK